VSAVEPRFVADKTLGRLARWLRILGYDVVYEANVTGIGLLREARRERRIVLTRNRRLVARPDAPEHLLVRSDRFRDQLREVISRFGLDPHAGLFQRCVECNTELVEIAPEELREGEVPAFVYQTQKRYRRCPRCRHLYWEATHVQRVKDELRRMGLVERGES
jgi:hypothetical protein